jgi:hypothetical protein
MISREPGAMETRRHGLGLTPAIEYRPDEPLAAVALSWHDAQLGDDAERRGMRGK